MIHWNKFNLLFARELVVLKCILLAPTGDQLSGVEHGWIKTVTEIE